MQSLRPDAFLKTIERHMKRENSYAVDVDKHSHRAQVSKSTKEYMMVSDLISATTMVVESLLLK